MKSWTGKYQASTSVTLALPLPGATSTAPDAVIPWAPPEGATLELPLRLPWELGWELGLSLGLLLLLPSLLLPLLLLLEREGSDPLLAAKRE